MNPDIQFVGSYTSWKEIPDKNVVEIAFAGRSNVGKSSLINALAGVKKLARVSSTPGKTQTLNVYLWKNICYWVDLPGVGYAKTSKTSRKMWAKMIEEYLLNSPRLEHVFYLVDISIPPQWVDGNFITWLLQNHIPLMVVFTKKDKVTSSKIALTLEQYEQWLSDHYNIIMPPHMVISSLKKENIDLLQNYVNELCK